MITLTDIKKNPWVLEFIKQTEIVLANLGYTEHGLRHANLTADRARTVAKEIGLSKREQEIAAIATFCHDMGSFISRANHHYFGALLFCQIFNQNFNPQELSLIIQAISHHDKEEMRFSNPISAVVVLADKSDVHRSRVIVRDISKIKVDIHDRVNWATKLSQLKIDKNKKKITLTLKIDTNFVPVMEYFEIFTNRMAYCRAAAEYLNYQFGLVINNFRLL